MPAQVLPQRTDASAAEKLQVHASRRPAVPSDSDDSDAVTASAAEEAPARHRRTAKVWTMLQTVCGRTYARPAPDVVCVCRQVIRHVTRHAGEQGLSRIEPASATRFSPIAKLSRHVRHQAALCEEGSSGLWVASTVYKRAQAGSGTAKRTGGTDEREFLRRAAVLGIRVSPYFAASGAYSDDDE